MSEIVNNGIWGIVGAAFALGFNYAKDLFNGKHDKFPEESLRERDARIREITTLEAEVHQLKMGFQEVKQQAKENQSRIGEQAGNLNALAQRMADRFDK